MPTALVDTHAHVFLKSLPMVADRRYTPDYDAPLSDYLAELDRAGIAHGIVVQPSFLGTDNSFLLDCLAAAAGRLKGVAVIDPNTADSELDRLDRSGIVGIRYNLLGKDPSLLLTGEHQDLIRQVSRRNWFVEVQVEGQSLPFVLDAIRDLESPIVIDHFGKPDPRLGLNCPGFRRLLGAGPQGNVYVKMSAPYRLGVRNFAPYADWLFRFLGAERLLWGSDWPWTQFEPGRVYVAEKEVVRSLCRAEDAWLGLHRTAAKLFGF
jgi:predicted TIM-barrel fold metal-dependent hydrolase